MPFCSQCGASLTGAFCHTCGAAAGGPQQQPAAQAGAPAPRRTSPIVWVLVVILGIIVLCGLGAAGVGYLVLHRARQAGLSFDSSRGGFAITGRNGSLEVGAAELPSWIPSYPGSKPAFGVHGQDNRNGHEGGEFTFTTPDSASEVLAFYERKCKEIGMTVELTAADDGGGKLIASDDDHERRLAILAAGPVRLTTVIVTYGRK